MKAFIGFSGKTVKCLNVSPGLTPDQRFFMSWATIWRIKYRNESLRTQLLTKVQVPGMYRANGAVFNMLEFYRAFGVKAGDNMFRDEKDR